MKNFDSRAYSINDFREWNDRGQLELTPRFQRRNVWSPSARSYLMDTIIRGKPIPKIFIRQKTNPITKATIREVVDGQQRLRTVLHFLEDGFKISKIHNPEYGGLLFSEFSSRDQRFVLDYEISADLLLDAPDEDVLDVFARLNSYSVTLSPQEKIHAKYFGAFKQMSYKLALEYTSFWREQRILTDQQILRMGEAELTSELLIAMFDGISAKSAKIIESYYKDYDKICPRSKVYMKRFRDTMDYIGKLMGKELRTSQFKRKHLFYTLFCSIYHMLYGISNLKSKRVSIKYLKSKVCIALEEVDQIFEKDDEELTTVERRFLEQTRRATTDASVRKARSEYVCKLIAKHIK